MKKGQPPTTKSQPTTTQDWALRLRGLLLKATNAAGSPNTDPILTVQEELQDFIDDSPDHADALDRIARGAIVDLAVANAQRALEQLQSRQRELDRLLKLIGGVLEEMHS
jgi:hypothetical protein